MVIDFRSSPSSPQPTSVKGQIVEWASCYKYLGLIIDNQLRFDTQVEAVCKKGQQHCLRRLSTFNISSRAARYFACDSQEHLVSYRWFCD